MIALYTAFTIGLIGSFHCIGMCGPIAVALPLGTGGLGSRFTGTLLYNIGRILTYGMLGALFGLLGKGFEMAGLQRWVSIAAGAFMIGWVIFPWMFQKQYKSLNLSGNIVSKVVFKLKKLFGKHSYTNLFLIGLLNGLLPCGLVYVAIAGAINTNDPLMGILFMVLFGLGTIPIMASVSIVSGVVDEMVVVLVPTAVTTEVVTAGCFIETWEGSTWVIFTE